MLFQPLVKDIFLLFFLHISDYSLGLVTEGLGFLTR